MNITRRRTYIHLLFASLCLASCGPGDADYFMVDASDPSTYRSYVIGVEKQRVDTCSMALSLERFVVVQPKKTHSIDFVNCSKEEDRQKNHPGTRQVELKVIYPVSSDFDSKRTLAVFDVYNFITYEWDTDKTYLVGLRKAGPDWFTNRVYPIEITNRPTDGAGEPVVFGNEILNLPATLGELSQSLEANQQDLSSCYPDPASYPFQPRSDESYERVIRTNPCSGFE